MGKKRKLLWTVISIVIAALTIWAVGMQGKNFSVEQLKQFLFQADKRWLTLAVLCMLGYIFFEGCGVLRICRFLGYPRCLSRGMLYSAADVYFSAITPSASGGQPASAFFMLQDKIPGTVVTIALLLNVGMYSMALFVIGLCSFLFQFELVMEFSVFSRVFIGIGAVVLLGLAGAFFLALKKGEILYGICSKAIALGEKLRLVRHGEEKKEKLLHSLTEYKRSADLLTGHAGVLFDVFFWNVCQRVSQFGISFMIFKALGYQTAVAGRIWVIQSFVSVGSNCVPIPGSMGVADYLMLDGFTHIVGEELAAYMELLCRGLAFYGCILTSIAIVLIGYLSGRTKKRT